MSGTRTALRLAIWSGYCTIAVDNVDIDGPSGFDWLPGSRLAAQIYTIRHLQQHTGELMERLGARAGKDVDWA
jgi:hypothetical protein